ncbi:S9 family peptidase [Aliidiomarina taiwanensis]|uniref:S9 family peptidase n=1 Tax=Aliidiomarina taiwanensis TaxID=946228 RepID=A0A432X1N8_9GAMM|nr:prolyl oligopeptidase family serine peptidase [Aliidiomarina taiwanensis]RUO40473.1 S9 family peptidase [Aliidiomarina taiwanensis]
MIKTKKSFLKRSALAASLWFAFSAAAVERDHVWVQKVHTNLAGVALADSAQTHALRDSLVQQWMYQLPTGSKLADESGEVQSVPVLQLPIATQRFTQGSLSVEGAEQVTFYVNGERIEAKGTTAELALRTGDHQVLVLVEGAKRWDDLTLQWEGKAEHDQIDTQRPDSLRLSQEKVFDTETTTLVEASPNGQYLVWRKAHYTPATGNKAQVDLQLFDVAANRTVYRWEGGDSRRFAWHGSSEKLAFVQGSHIKLLDVASLELTTLTAELPGVGNLLWADDTTLLFNWTKKGEQDGDMIKHYRALEDRWSYFRDNSQVYALNTRTQVLQQLTQGSSSVSLRSVHANGKQVLLSQRLLDYAEPAHSLTKLQELNLETGELLELGEHRTLGAVTYVGDAIYVVAGPEFGNGAGRNLPEGWLANNYDGQLYQLQRNGQVTALSLDFDPAIGGIEALANGNVLLSVTERDTTQLYTYEVEQGTFQKLATGLDVISSFSVSDQAEPRVYFAGTGATAPSRMAYMPVTASEPTVLWDSASQYQDYKIHDIREWNFKNKAGDTIYGRVHLPPNFNPEASYPALVYYYGGTSPVQRAFTGRYPFNQWAAQGYVVYVIQPSGATGFGQEFSARHVNAWGDYTAEDIIDGTKQFLAAHSFVDADRVGHLGASYGGFMTMLLATKTDIFSASMSHAGISNITSYWGEGWWGFLYSGEASKGSFPWNNPELYTEHSPVFHADKVTAPMLLIHGDADTNVPPGESHHMYTALKILGKEVELVEFKGADHHIIPRDARFRWWDTYMAFFDKHLKGQPEWWNYLHPRSE